MTCSRTGRRPPRRLKLTLDSLAFGGDAVGRDDDGRVTFVPGGAPGDLAEVELEEEKKGFARARLARLLRPSEERVDPPCPRFAEGCGGCQWQHVTLAAQHAAKADVVKRALRHLAPPEAFQPLDAPAPAYGWRRRARLRFRRGKLGYFARRSHDLVDVPECPQLEPALDQALGALRAALLPSLGEASGELELLLTGRGQIHVSITWSSPPAPPPPPGGAGSGPPARAARSIESPSPLGCDWASLPVAGVILNGKVVAGAETVDLTDDSASFFTRADAFLQASDGGNAALRRHVFGALMPLAGKRVLELYAGSGNFTRDLVGAGAHVIAVEDAPLGAALFRKNLADPHADCPPECFGVFQRGKVELVEEAVETALSRLSGPFDAVLLDPPRTGMAAGAPGALAALGAPCVVYVSCDPSTLARDLAAMPGYRVTTVTPVDLMPQTFHVETVVVLTRVA